MDKGKETNVETPRKFYLGKSGTSLGASRTWVTKGRIKQGGGAMAMGPVRQEYYMQKTIPT